jgi:hypothetical protein
MATPRGHRFAIEFDNAFPQGLILIDEVVPNNEYQTREDKAPSRPVRQKLDQVTGKQQWKATVTDPDEPTAKRASYGQPASRPQPVRPGPDQSTKPAGSTGHGEPPARPREPRHEHQRARVGWGRGPGEDPPTARPVSGPSRNDTHHGSGAEGGVMASAKSVRAWEGAYRHNGRAWEWTRPIPQGRPSGSTGDGRRERGGVVARTIEPGRCLPRMTVRKRRWTTMGLRGW